MICRRHIAVMIFLVSCAPPSTRQRFLSTRETKQETVAVSLTREEFIAGVTALPESPERKTSFTRMGQLFRQTWSKGHHLSATPLSLATEQRQSAKLLSLSFPEPTDSVTCAPEEAIRLYRGLGRRKLLSGGRDNKVYDVYGAWRTLVEKSSSSLTFPPSDFRWHLGWDRHQMRDVPGKGPAPSPYLIDFHWGRLLADHSVASNHSPFLSTTLTPFVAMEYGPTAIVLDVCPHRAFLNTVSTWAFEQEYLVPFFILPEEIRAVVPTTELPAWDRLHEPSRMTRVLRACHSNHTRGRDEAFQDAMATYSRLLDSFESPGQFNQDVLGELGKVCSSQCIHYRLSESLSAWIFVDGKKTPQALDAGARMSLVRTGFGPLGDELTTRISNTDGSQGTVTFSRADFDSVAKTCVDR